MYIQLGLFFAGIFLTLCILGLLFKKGRNILSQIFPDTALSDMLNGYNNLYLEDMGDYLEAAAGGFFILSIYILSVLLLSLLIILIYPIPIIILLIAYWLKRVNKTDEK